MELRVRPARDEDLDEVLTVLQGTFGASGYGNSVEQSEYWSWLYDGNPDCYPGSEALWVADMNGMIAGVCATMPASLIVRGEVRHTYWLQKLAVRPEARRKGVAGRLFRAIHRHQPLLLGAGLTDDARALWTHQRVRFVDAEASVVYPLSKAHILRNLAGAAYRRRFTEFSQIAGGVRRRLFSRRRDRTLDVTAMPRFGREFEPFLTRLADQIPVLPLRSVDKLNWVLANPKHPIAALAASRSGEPCGYAVYRRDGLLLDLLVDPADLPAFEAIHAALASKLRAEGALQIFGVAPGFPAIARMYQNVGYLPWDRFRFGLFYSLPDPDEVEEVLENPENWYVSMADSDMHSFRLREW